MQLSQVRGYQGIQCNVSTKNIGQYRSDFLGFTRTFMGVVLKNPHGSIGECEKTSRSLVLW